MPIYGHRKSDQTHLKGTRIVHILKNGLNSDHGLNFWPHSRLCMLHLFSTGSGREVYDSILLNRSDQFFWHLILLFGLRFWYWGYSKSLYTFLRSNLLFKRLKIKKIEDFILWSSIFIKRGMVVLLVNDAILLCKSSQPFRYLKLQNLNNFGYFIHFIIFFTTRGEVVWPVNNPIFFSS